jgi:cyclophilin family peptidyl-prolyl cis-trans isomerase
MANKRVNNQRVRQGAGSRRRREEERQEKQKLQNRLISAGAAILILIVVAVFVFQLGGLTGDEENNGEQTVLTGEGTLIETDRSLADMSPDARNGFYDEFPEMMIDTSKSYQAVIRTDKGDMTLVLFDDEAPLTVNNFVYLASNGYYDNTIFHRVLSGFMAQAGDPTGTGTGGPGYQFADETDNGLIFDRPYLLAMANSGPATNGSQFFITFVPTPHLDGGHTIFGELLEGEEVLNSITLVDPSNPADQSVEEDVILSIDIYES